MSCPKCGGLMATYYGEERCLNCGMRHGDLTRKVGDDVGRPIFTTRKCHWCKESAAPGRSMCRKHLNASMDRKRLERQQRREAI